MTNLELPSYWHRHNQDGPWGVQPYNWRNSLMDIICHSIGRLHMFTHNMGPTVDQTLFFSVLGSQANFAA